MGARDGEDAATAPTQVAANRPDDTLPLSESTAETVGLPSGARLGRYVIVERLGGGGMGVVYAAYDPELDRKVALKLLRMESTGSSGVSEGRTRLLREAQAMARLAHPNVIAVHDVGTADGQVFIAMELVPGETLAAWQRAERRPWRALVAAYAEAGRGLAAAHAAGLVHRDFKPDNVLRGSDGRVRVLDFGLARAVLADPIGPTPSQVQAVLATSRLASDSSSPVLETPLTRVGAVLGTPGYMPPEHLLGQVSDERGDQFSYCVALWEALYHQPPYRGETEGERLDAINAGRITPPPDGTGVPARVRRVLERGLAARPEARFPSMDALLAELAIDPGARWRRWLGAAALIAIALSLVVAWRVERRRQATQCAAGGELAGVWDEARRHAVEGAFRATGKPYAGDAFNATATALDGYARAWTAMHVEACEATRVRGQQSERLLELRDACLARRRDDLRALTALLSTADAALVDHAAAAAHALPRLDACADASALEAATPPPSDPALRARIAELGARIAQVSALERAGRYDEGEKLAQPALADAEQLAWPPLVAQARLAAGLLAKARARYDQATRTLADAALDGDAARDDLLSARAYVELMGTEYAQAHYDETRRWGLWGRAKLARGGGDEELLGHLLTIDALALYEQDHHADAVAQLRRALVMREHALGPDAPEVADTLTDLATSLDHASDGGGEALALEKRALAIYTKAYGPVHPDVAMALTNLGASAAQARRWDELLDDERRALALYEQLEGPEHPDLIGPLDGVVYGLVQLHRYDDALPFAERGLAVAEKALGKDHPSTAYPLHALGQLQLLRHHPELALDLFERAVRIREARETVPIHVAESRFGLAQALWDAPPPRRDRARARRLAEAALVEYRKVHDLTHSVADVEKWVASHTL